METPVSPEGRTPVETEPLLEHLEDTQGLGAIFPPMVYILIVFRALGYSDDQE